ncbi:MAG: histidine kinase [Defluviitaleaceae bacterium]|nr:histidine kinase [Defluviitaleaceae bacterium]MCL2837114.1 histidine kinase [Defluviitaleaceae bacterium]
MRGASLYKRFIAALIIYALLILALWFGYHTVTYDSFRQSAVENAELAVGRLLDQVSAEFLRMRNIAEVITASSYVQDFLAARTVEEYYTKVEIASEIIRNAAYPISSTDNVITINSDGAYYRFSGGLSNAACDTLYDRVRWARALYTITELDGALYFFHSSPVHRVINTSIGKIPERVGTVVLLTHLDRKRSVLNASNMLTGIDTAVIHDGVILLSSDSGLEGRKDSELNGEYGMVSRIMIEGSDIVIASVVRNEAMFPGRTLFLAVSFAVLGVLLATIVVLYRYLSGYFVKPMTSVIGGVASLGGELSGRLSELPAAGKPDFESLVLAINALLSRAENNYNELLDGRQKLFDAELLRRDMRIGLLNTQIDAHFVVNTITSIRALSERGDNEKAGRMADGLAKIIKHRHNGDALRNLFVEFEMIEQYVDVMNIRYDDQFTVDYYVDDVLATYLIPGFILQPVVENALIHGLLNKDGNAVMQIRGCIKDNAILIEISDNGSGIAPAKLKELQDTLETAWSGNILEPGLDNVALSNVQRRIRLRFGELYGLSINSLLGEGTAVTIKLPATLDTA